MAVHRDFGVKNGILVENGRGKRLLGQKCVFWPSKMIFGLKMGFGGNGHAKGLFWLKMGFWGEMAMQRDFWVKDGVWEKIAVQRDFGVKDGVLS